MLSALHGDRSRSGERAVMLSVHVVMRCCARSLTAHTSRAPADDDEARPRSGGGGGAPGGQQGDGTWRDWLTRDDAITIAVALAFSYGIRDVSQLRLAHVPEACQQCNTAQIHICFERTSRSSRPLWKTARIVGKQ